MSVSSVNQKVSGVCEEEEGARQNSSHKPR